MRQTEPEGADRPLPELFRTLAEEFTTLLRQELLLARVEVSAKVREITNALPSFGVAAILALGAFGALVTAIIAALALLLPVWAAALVVAVVFGIAALVLALRGRSALRHAAPLIPQQTISSVQQDAAAVRAGIQRGR